MVVDMAIALKVAVSAWRPCFAQMRTVTRSCASTRAQVRDGRSVAARLRLAPASARHRHKEAAAVATRNRDASLACVAGGCAGATSHTTWWSSVAPIVPYVRGPSRGVFISARALGDASGGGDDDDDGHGAFLGLAGQPSRRADVCVFRVERDLEDVAEALRAGVGSDTNSSVLATGACFAIGQIRLGRRSRHRRANERAAGAFRAKGFTRVRVLHLLSDREHERTLACRVGYG